MAYDVNKAAFLTIPMGDDYLGSITAWRKLPRALTFNTDTACMSVLHSEMLKTIYVYFECSCVHTLKS
jgi:hypothetical protein